MKEKITELLAQNIREYLEEIDDSQIEINDDFVILGNHLFDSFDIVAILSTFEADLNDEYGVNITLSNEKAMSIKNSPYLNVNSLVKYAMMVIDEN